MLVAATGVRIHEQPIKSHVLANGTRAAIKSHFVVRFGPEYGFLYQMNDRKAPGAKQSAGWTFLDRMRSTRNS
jgi:hypothetical protein